ncbi:hypothetical protein IGI80_002849 [Enterococcus sp. DIV1420a]
MLLSTGLFGTISALADANVPVTYHNYNQIPDPTNPDNPDWILQVPASIEFTNVYKEEDASIKLVPRGAAALPANGVKVEVQSTNAYKLKKAGATDVAYSLAYDATFTGAVKTEVGVLTTATPEKAGLAKLLGQGHKVGDYTDNLTYYATAVNP